MRIAEMGGDGVLHGTDGRRYGGLKPSKPVARPVPRRGLGQTPPPQGKSTPRLMAEKLSVPASSLSYSPKVGNPASQIYPGRLVWTNADNAVYSVSFRPAPEGRVKLFELEGPARGTYREVTIQDLSTYHVVVEPDGAVLRNLMPIPTPRGIDGAPLETDVQYVTSALSGAMIMLGSEFPRPHEMGDTTKREDAFVLAASATSMAMEAVDSAAISYDAYAIGKKAFFILAHVGQHFLAGALAILDTINQAKRDDTLYEKTALMARKLQDEYTLWGALLTRAFLWSTLNDAADAVLYGSLATDSAVQASLLLGDLKTKRTQLLSNGKASASDVDSAVTFLEQYTKNFSALDKAYNERFAEDAKDLGIKRADLALSSMVIPKYLAENARSIKALRDGISIQGDLSGLGMLGNIPSVPKIPEAVTARLTEIRNNVKRSKDFWAKEGSEKTFLDRVRLSMSEVGSLRSLFDIMVSRWKTLVKVTDLSSEQLSSIDRIETAVKKLDNLIKGKREALVTVEEGLKSAKTEQQHRSYEGSKRKLTEEIQEAEEARTLIRSGSTLIDKQTFNAIGKTINEVGEITKAAQELKADAPEAEIFALFDRLLTIVAAPPAKIYFSEFSPAIEAGVRNRIGALINSLYLDTAGARALSESVVTNMLRDPKPEHVREILIRMRDSAEKDYNGIEESLASEAGTKVLSDRAFVEAIKARGQDFTNHVRTLNTFIKGLTSSIKEIPKDAAELVKAVKKPRGERGKAVKEAAEKIVKDAEDPANPSIIEYKPLLDPPPGAPKPPEQVVVEQTTAAAKEAVQDLKTNVANQPESAIEAQDPNKIVAKAEKVVDAIQTQNKAVAVAEASRATVVIQVDAPKIPEAPRKSRRVAQAKKSATFGLGQASQTKVGLMLTGLAATVLLAGLLGRKLFGDGDGIARDPRLNDAFPPTEPKGLQIPKEVLYVGGGILAIFAIRSILSE